MLAVPPARLIVSAAAPGPAQMALDEALLVRCAVAPEGSASTLRLYQFAPPCLSLGYFQPLADTDVDACARAGIDLVRRPTGGRAVLHECDLTYAMVAPVDGQIFTGGVRRSAERIGAALQAAVRQLGAADAVTAPGRVSAPRRGRDADCFAVAGAHELTLAGRKLAGSAQVRRGPAALQHGTLRLRAGAGDPRPFLGPAGERHDGPGPASVEEAVGRSVPFAEAATAVAVAFAEAFGLRFEAGALTEHERALATRLEFERYRCREWTARR